MFTNSKIISLILFFGTSFSSVVYSQDTLIKPKKNIIKVNITSGFLYDVPLLFEYERILKSHQSFSIQVGYSRLPLETNTDSLRLTSSIQSSGYNVTVDYRFYLKKENKDAAPHGIYLAPFASYYHFSNDRDWSISRDSVKIPFNVKAQYNFVSVGGELGYQFTFGKRWVLDCLLLGPSISYYQVEMKLDGNIPVSEMNEIMKGLLERAANRFPLLNQLFKSEIGSFTGSSSSWNYGFRYSIHFGYRF